MIESKYEDTKTSPLYIKMHLSHRLDTQIPLIRTGRCGRRIPKDYNGRAIQLNIQKLQTITHHRLLIKIVVLNNQSPGIVRQFQQSYFLERYPAACLEYSAPDLSKVARAYRIESLTVSDPCLLSAALGKMWINPQDPFLLQISVDVSVNAYPKIAFGHPMAKIEPFSKPLEKEGT